MKKILKVNEFIKTEYVQIVEQARIGKRTSDFPYDVFVRGGNSYGSGRNEHGEPHFHFSDKSKSFEFSILIPTKTQWKQHKELYIIESSNKELDWTGFRKEKRALIKWLDENSHGMDDVKITNMQMIRTFWNGLNSDNGNVDKI